MRGTGVEGVVVGNGEVVLKPKKIKEVYYALIDLEMRMVRGNSNSQRYKLSTL